MRVRFVDSSDDGASHEAAMDLRSAQDDGAESTESSMRGASRQPYVGGEEAENKDTNRRQGSRRGGGWLSSMLDKGVNAASGLFLEPRNDSPHEPVEDVPFNAQLPLTGPNRGSGVVAGSHMPDRLSSSSGGWEFDRVEHRSSMELVPPTESASTLEGNDLERDSDPDQVNLNLKDTLLLFIQTDSDVFMNIILATLKASNELVDGETFEIVSGNPALLKVFLDSGRVDIDDPRVQSVVQTKLGEVLAGDPYDGDVVSGDLLNYVRSLCSIQTSRITFQQMVLLRYSGFDYVELLIDYPYLLEDLEKPSFCIYLVFDVLHYISIAISWIGVLITLTFTAMVLWSVVFWFQRPEHRNNGYWIIITYVGGYVVSIVATMRAEDGKIKRYENQVWQYPNNLFRIVPIIPVYEIMLSYVLLRYEISANAKRFFIIRYDLRNGSLVQHIANGCFYALPQMILQTFLFTSDALQNHRYLQGAYYWLLLGCSLTLITMSIFAYHRIAFFTHSCNSFRFAVLSSQSTSTKDHTRVLARRVHPSDIATKIFIFFTIYFIVAQTVTLVVLMLTLHSSTRIAIIFPAVYMAVLGLSIIVIVVVSVNLSFSRGMGAIGIPVALMQIAFLVYINVGATGQESIFKLNFTWMIPSIVIFGMMCLSMVAWLTMLLFELFRGVRITQQAVDHYILS
ncbi:conserved hypothetical protein [Leishmania mexicana MHOM/GT/2001/U1103]|uniref:Uncharacterized protein n=1 Tax=Leishmania mexicana (strain MHOM/GT/2001/U1103) TaxID=929439 RepID=E9B2Z2_LEIMU|nr:conserved hypothetical protein [Leishmania mexicana MHOM/GT/2001/U1103]CBZ29606.1 conserved hypothetical protein [Leishmania mexicana MHOM/GT/2001/U1103]